MTPGEKRKEEYDAIGNRTSPEERKRMDNQDLAIMLTAIIISIVLYSLLGGRS